MLPGILQDAGVLLTFAGLALFGVFLSGVLGGLFPPQLLDPAWQLRFGELLIGSAPFALLGSCLLLLGACMDPDNRMTERWLQRTRRFAWIACLGYLLMIPLQASALMRMGARVEAPLRQQIEQLSASRKQVSDSRSLPQLDRALRTLPGSPKLPPGFSRPLPGFRSEVLARLDERLVKLQESQRVQNRQRHVGEVLLFLRLGGISAILSGVFAAFALRDVARGSWLEQLALMRSRAQADAEGQPYPRGGGSGVDPYFEQLARAAEQDATDPPPPN